MRLINADRLKEVFRRNTGYDYADIIDMQVNVLDKIRAEIEQIEINGNLRDVECFNAGMNAALSVIDKYKAESEGEK